MVAAIGPGGPHICPNQMRQVMRETFVIGGAPFAEGTDQRRGDMRLVIPGREKDAAKAPERAEQSGTV